MQKTIQGVKNETALLFLFSSQYHYYGAHERLLTFEGFPKNRRVFDDGSLGGQPCVFSQAWGVSCFENLL